MIAIEVKNIEDLPQAAATIIKTIVHKNIVAFYGPMGAGKTTLIKEICKQLGVTDVVSSPTFSIVNNYATPNGKIIYHFDFYRIKNLSEAFDMGYEEYFYSGNNCFIEWPEKIEQLLPVDALKVNIALNQSARVITIAE